MLGSAVACVSGRQETQVCASCRPGQVDASVARDSACDPHPRREVRLPMPFAAAESRAFG